MSKPGFFNMLLGLIWFAAGVSVTALVYLLTPGGMYLFTAGIILVGIVQFAIGLWQYSSYRMKSPEDKALHHAKIETRALVRSMVAMAAADGKLDKEEIKTVTQVYERLTGKPLEPALVIKITETMQGGKYSIYEDLGSRPATRQLVCPAQASSAWPTALDSPVSTHPNN